MRAFSTATSWIICLLLSIGGVSSVDESFPDAHVKKIAFGSCHKVKRGSALLSDEKSVFAVIAEKQPDVFIWTGDAVYSGKRSWVSDLRSALSELSSFPPYVALKAAVPLVFGVWDDHDFGKNDSGGETTDKPERLAAYLDFLGVSASSPRRRRAGNYYSVLLNSSPQEVVKLVFLDTRWHRSPHYLPSVGGVSRLPLAAVLASLGRLATSLLGLGSSYGGAVLGEEQWRWLDGELRDSDADYHVLVSSVQVLTSNPMVESWGHFPVEKERLLNLIKDTKPRGFILLSGDVHHAELSKVGNVIEVTSSGKVVRCLSSCYY